MASVEDRFKAAVNVIKGLPKNGPYQPSNTMMLKFYGYYKQATEGTCTQKKPAFWDVVGRAKWEAWKSRGHLTKHQAMQEYVDSLREIIETMSFTENVADFVGSISGLDNINWEELDMVAPGMREMAESHPNSPFNSRTNSPQHGASSNGTAVSDTNESPSTSSAAETVVDNTSKTTTINGHHLMQTINGNVEGDDDDDDSNDDVGVGDGNVGVGTGTDPVAAAGSSAQQTHSMELRTSTATANYAVSTSTMEPSDDEYGDPVDVQHDFTDAMIHHSELLKQVQATVLRMNADLVSVKQRMTSLERGVQDVRFAVQQKLVTAKAVNRSHQRWPQWWPFRDISPQWFVLLLLWPIVLSRMSRMFLPQRRK